MNRTTRATFYCYFCCRHILIAFVGMTLLIVSYGVNRVQMSAVPHRISNCYKSNNNSIKCFNGKEVLSSINAHKYHNKSLGKGNEVTKNFDKIALPETPITSKKEFKFFNNSNTTKINQTRFHSDAKNFRNPRFFGLFGSNFSLSYNLTLSSGNSVGNITVVSAAPAPAYYYYPAPAPYYNYYNAYNAYNPYAYQPQYYYFPNTGYGYYA